MTQSHHWLGPRLLGLVLAYAAACSRPEATAPGVGLSAPLPTDFRPETKLRIGDPTVQLQLSLVHQRPPFAAEWYALSGGPKTIEAFRARALDASTVGDTPPIHAGFTGLDVKIIGVQQRNKAAMRIATAPGSALHSVADLRGKRIAYSPGQAQGALVLRALKHAGIATREVTLIEIESDMFKDALASHQVDAAPLGGPGLTRYLREYGDAGAFDHGVRDNLTFFYVPTEVLTDADKAAALRTYVGLRERALLWTYDHKESWVEAYYQKDQGLSREEGLRVIEAIGRPEFPTDWSEAIALTQETIDLLAAQSGQASYDAKRLFDRRFESVASELTARLERP